MSWAQHVRVTIACAEELREFFSNYIQFTVHTRLSTVSYSYSITSNSRLVQYRCLVRLSASVCFFSTESVRAHIDMEEQEEEEEASWRGRGEGRHGRASTNSRASMSPPESPKKSMTEVGPPRRTLSSMSRSLVFSLLNASARFFFSPPPTTADVMS